MGRSHSDEGPTSPGTWSAWGRWSLKHKAGSLSLIFLLVLGLGSVLADFISLNPPSQVAKAIDERPSSVPPMGLSTVAEGNLRWPFVCARQWKNIFNSKTHLKEWKFKQDCAQQYVLRFFVHNPNYRYKLFGVLETDLHLFGMSEPGTAWFLATAVPEAPLLPLGSNSRGQDLFSLILVNSRVSLKIILVAVLLSLALALPLGGLSGYLGGKTDTLIQRVVDGIMAFPRFLLLLALGASIVDVNLRFWGMVFILGFVGWAPMARTLRGQILPLQKMDFIEAAKASGAGHVRILRKHVLPQTTSTILVSITLAIPNILVLESFLSYLGRGVPDSWGSLLKDMGETVLLSGNLWWLFPGIPIILTVLACIFLGDALHDWTDPFSRSSAEYG